MSTTSVQFRLKRRTTAQWATAPNLAEGEPGYEIGTGRLKIGTGSATWAQLPYVSNVRTDTAGNWAVSPLILGNGEIGYESNTGYMKVGNGTGTWNALSYTATFSLTNITPLLGVPSSSGVTASGSSTGWYRRIIPPANKIDQVEFYPAIILMDPSGTATMGGEARVYESAGVDNVGAIKTTSYPISVADWNTAAVANTSIKATLQAPFPANGTSGYIAGAASLGGYGLAPSNVRLNNVTITASVGGSANISWASVTGGSLTVPTTFQRRVLYGTGIVSGTYLNYTAAGSTGGTITNVNYPSAVTVSSVMLLDTSVIAVLTGVTISPTSGGSSNISWTGSSTATGSAVSSFNGTGYVLSNRNVNVGSAPTTPASLPHAPTTAGTGTISAPIPYATTVTIPSLDIVQSNSGYRKITEYIGVTVSDVSTFTINSTVEIAGSGTSNNNGTFVIKSINTTTKTLFISGSVNAIPFIGTGATAKPPGGSTVSITSIFTPGTVRVTVSSSITGIAIGNTATIASATGGNNVTAYPVTSFDTASNSFTIINLNGVTQTTGGTVTISTVNSGNSVNISAVTPLALMDNDPTRYFSNTYGGIPFVAFSSPRVYNNSPFVNLYTTDVVSSGGSGVDAVSTATVTSALSQVSTVTSNNAVGRINGTCDILLPRKLRLLARQGEEFSIYNKHLITGNWHQNGVIDYSLSSGSYGRQLNECVRFTGNELTAGTPLFSLTSTVRDYNWNTALARTTAVNVSDMTTASAVRYLSIGDSITRRCQYQQEVMGLGFTSSPISSITVASPIVTVNVTSTSGFKVGDTVRIVGATNVANDLSSAITQIVSSTQFTFNPGGSPVAQPAAGGRVVVGAVASSRVTNCAFASGILTVTVGSNTGFVIGDSVTLRDISTRNNISARIESLLSSTGFTIKHEGGENSSAVGSAITSNINTVGTRYDVYNTPLLNSFSSSNTGYAVEGRGGWAVSTYLSSAQSNGFDSPFMFPSALTAAQYRGNTEFWKRAIAVDSGGTCIVTVASMTGINVGTSVTIANASDSANNVTRNVVSLIGTNSFSIRNDSAVAQATVTGTVTPSSGAATNIQSITPLSMYDYQGFGRAAREGVADTYAYNSTGYPTSPSTGWRVYDPSKAGVKFQQWSGSAWIDDTTTYTFVFDYAKYLSRYSWAFPSNPTHVSILLGANDYNSNEGDEPINFASWIANYKIIVESIRSVASTNVIVLLPTMPSSQDGYGGTYGLGVLSERARRNFQTASRALINEFDTDPNETNKVFVCLFGAGGDPTYGYTLNNVAPNKYITDNSLFIRRSADGIHPEISSMYQSGDWLAATIQGTR